VEEKKGRKGSGKTVLISQREEEGEGKDEGGGSSARYLRKKKGEESQTLKERF